MKSRYAVAALGLLAASCTTKNENSALVITAILPAVATASGSGATATVSCKFDPTATEFTYLPYNPAENRGYIAALVQNNLTSTASLAPTGFRTDSTTFLPHQAVVTYEFVGVAGTPPGQMIYPAGAGEVASGAKSTVGFDVFRGTTISAPSGTFIRVYVHLEGKLLDGSTVHTSEREYLFQYCTTPGCGTGGSWAAQAGTTTISCY